MTADQEILEELKQITRLMAAIALRDMPQRDKIEILNTAGFQPKAIASLIGTTPNTVSVALSKMRRSGPGRRKVEEDA